MASTSEGRTPAPTGADRGDANFQVGTRLVGESARARVWEIRLAPGERVPFHRHRSSYFWVVHEGSDARVGFEDGSGENFRHEQGEVTYIAITPGERVVHDLTNVGERPLVITTIELLQNDELFWKPVPEGQAQGGPTG
jgi:mannose-6-phosphate isomerase-like protein (cupin superfamily)